MPSREAWLTDDFGPLQLVQAGVLVAALVIMLRHLARLGFRHHDSSVAVVLGFLVLFLTLREIEVEHHLWRVHAFSWKYLVRPDVPLGVKLGLGIPSMALALAVLLYLLSQAPLRMRPILGRWRAPSLQLLAVGIGVLTVSQLWDKSSWLAHSFGLTAFRSSARDPAPEEILELIGELLLLFCVVEFGKESAT